MYVCDSHKYFSNIMSLKYIMMNNENAISLKLIKVDMSPNTSPNKLIL